MKKACAAWFAVSLTALTTQSAWAQHIVGFKSPGPGMHFTAGLPVVVFLDLFETPYGSGFGSFIKGVGWPQGQVLMDGATLKDDTTGSATIAGPKMLNSQGNPTPVDFYRLAASGLAAGPHQIVARGLFEDQTMVDSPPIAITIDPWPSAKTQVSLKSGDVTMGPLTWDGVAVRGNGASLTVNGDLVIKNSLVTGLTKLTVTGGKIDIEGSIFEDTGVIQADVSSDVVVKNNEFRANNRLAFVEYDPSVPNIVDFEGHGNTSQVLFQGNRVGAGIVNIQNAQNWLIGGDTDAESNILMGPRCVFNIIDSADVTLRGNYAHHNYVRGWSQGFNFYFYGSTQGIVAEHNLIRGGSWPVQGVAGQFRYNVVYGYGHDWIRSGAKGAVIHHNLFVPESAGEFGGGFYFYEDETGLDVYNNTFDCGGKATGDCGGQMMNLTGQTSISSLRNNLFTYSRNQDNDNPGSPGITSMDQASYLSADYNAFYSPDNDTKDNYAISIAGKTEGSDGFAGHDVSGMGAVGVIDGQLASHPFAGARILPYDTVVDEGAVWNGTQKLSAVLAAFRARYTPKADSPIVDKGDPQDNDAQGRRADIGAIDLAGHDQDKLGKFGMPPSELVPPTVTLTMPAAGATVTGTTMLSADAEDNPGGSGVVLVQFEVDGSTVAQTAKQPYMVSFDSSLVSNGDHDFSAKAWDAAGNFGVSSPVKVHVTGNSSKATSSSTSSSGVGGAGSGGAGGGSVGSSHGSSGVGGAGSGGGGSGSGNGKGGCGCAVPGDRGAPAGWALALGFAWAATRRRRLRR